MSYPHHHPERPQGQRPLFPPIILPPDAYIVINDAIKPDYGPSMDNTFPSRDLDWGDD